MLVGNGAIRRSQFVGRSESESKSYLIDDDDSHKEDDHFIKRSDVMNLPTQSLKTAEYLGMRSGFPVSREKHVQEENKKTLKRKYDVSVFEDEFPIKPFSSLPHPNDLFNKRGKIEAKRKKIKINPVDYHIKQLHEKQAKLDLATNEVKRKGGQESGSDSSHDYSNNSSKYLPKPNVVPVSKHASLKTQSFNDSTDKMFELSFSEYPSMKRPFPYQDKTISPTHFPFSFSHSENFEE